MTVPEPLAMVCPVPAVKTWWSAVRAGKGWQERRPYQGDVHALVVRKENLIDEREGHATSLELRQAIRIGRRMRWKSTPDANLVDGGRRAEVVVVAVVPGPRRAVEAGGTTAFSDGPIEDIAKEITRDSSEPGD